MKNMKSNITVSKSQTSLSHHSNSENAIQNDNLIPQSQCPLCFNLYPTPDIEVIYNIFLSRLNNIDTGPTKFHVASVLKMFQEN